MLYSYKTLNSSRTPYKESSTSDFEKSLISLLKWIVFGTILALGILLVFRFTLNPTLIDGNSMSPTLKNGQIWLSSSTLVEKPQLGDIVRAYSSDDGKTVVKRVVALKGDVLKVSDKGIFLNGELVDNSKETISLIGNTTTWVGTHVNSEVKLSGDEFFLMGDNRNNSKDSRYYGLVRGRQIQTILTNKAPAWLSNLLK